MGVRLSSPSRHNFVDGIMDGMVTLLTKKNYCIRALRKCFRAFPFDSLRP